MYYIDLQDKYEDYLEWFERERDKDSDYDIEPMTYYEFENGYVERNEND